VRNKREGKEVEAVSTDNSDVKFCCKEKGGDGERLEVHPGVLLCFSGRQRACLFAEGVDLVGGGVGHSGAKSLKDKRAKDPERTHTQRSMVMKGRIWGKRR
jgi:hypothetical protein